MAQLHAIVSKGHLHIQNPSLGGDFGYQIALNFISTKGIKISSWKGNLYTAVMFPSKKKKISHL